MVEEYQYTQTVIRHDNWHDQGTSDPSNFDSSCPICFGISEYEVSEDFHHFWEHWIVLRCGGDTYTQYTYRYYQELGDESTQFNIIFKLLKTIRYQSVHPPLLIEELAEKVNQYYALIEA
ncbi:hypothetical protein, partial [Arachidicoccus sp.]|uniref:hypothetical protein n=1 Tax=Arachidicoccus sp. TaxID=1872624 RepID=UPI003D1EE178